MIALVVLDTPPTVLLDEMMEDGSLPTIAAVASRATKVRLETPSTLMTAATYPSLWSGQEPAEHGIYYPFQWVGDEQRVRFYDTLDRPEPIWERVSAHGATSVAIDAYESSRPRLITGAYVSGWQFANRVVLPRAVVPGDAMAAADPTLRPGAAVDEVFGRPTARGLSRIARTLRQAPGRAADAAVALMRRYDPDLLVVAFPAVHIGGHQLFDPGAVVHTTPVSGLHRALRDVVVATDRALDRVLGALPAGADLIVMTPHGMGPNTSRVELLPSLIDSILQQDRAGKGDRATRLRSLVPVSVRAQVARVLPAGAALELASRISTPVYDWSTTRAFAVPCDTNGLVRINQRGREREGIVGEGAVEGLLDELEEGLRTFELPTGEPIVRFTQRIHETVAAGPKVSMLPDLAVAWTTTPARAGEIVSSRRFGTLRGPGSVSGRSGNHDDEAWALLAPGRAVVRTPPRPPRVTDIAATIGALLGVETVGEPLLVPADVNPTRSDAGMS